MTTAQSQPSVYHIVMFSFADTTSADAIVEEIKDNQKAAGYKIAAEAVVIREADGHVRIHEPGRGGVGGTIGAVAGGLLGLLGGPAGILALAVAGGVAGGVAGHFMGRTIPADELKKVGDALPPNSSAFVVLVEDVVAETIIRDLKIPNANIVTLTVGDELSGVVASGLAAEFGPESGGQQAAATGSAAGGTAGAAPTGAAQPPPAAAADAPAAPSDAPAQPPKQP
jgi:uncharacterized membrane protein